MTAPSTLSIPLNAMITTRDEFESDQRLIIDEEDKNNNDKLGLLSSSGNTTRSNSPLSTPKIASKLKLKPKQPLESYKCNDEKLNSIISGFSKDSQLRRALEKGPQKKMPQIASSIAIPSESATMSLSSTPLLAASLSRPPVASPSTSLATLASAAVAASATSSTMNIDVNVVDLSQKSNNNRPKKYNSGATTPTMNNKSNSISSAALYEQLSIVKDNQKGPLRSPSEVYANLLMQLRNAQARINTGSRSLSPLAVVQQVQDQNIQESTAVNTNSPFNNINNCKLTAAARKEKLRLQTSFQCPVCKKRFQRHIALNAHFQNEHIGSKGHEKQCKLCTVVCSDITSIRSHLLTSHGVDLDTPSACLVEAEHLVIESPNNVRQATNSSPPSPSSSSSPFQFSSSSENVEQPFKSNKCKIRKRKSNNPSPTNEDGHQRALVNDSFGVHYDTAATYDESSSSSLTSNVSTGSMNAVDDSISSSLQPPCNAKSNGNKSSVVDNKPSSQYMKQDIVDQNSNSRHNNHNNCDEATDLSIKKSPKQDLPSSSSVKRALPTRSFDKETSFNESNSCSLMLKKPKLETKNDNIDASVSALLNQDDIDENSKLKEMGDESVFQFKCQHCSIVFPNQTLYFLHRGFHSEGSNPWRCNGCGRGCKDMYDFNTHLMSDSHC